MCFGNMCNQMGQMGMGNQMGENNMFNSMNNNTFNSMNSNMFNSMNNNMFNSMNNNNNMFNNMNNNNMFNNMNNNNMFNNMNNNMSNCNNQGSNNDLRNINDTGYDPFKGNIQRRINVFFEDQKGKRIMMPVPANITVFELLDGFFKKVGILNPELQNGANFLFNGICVKRLIGEKKNKNNTLITNAGFSDGSKVLVTSTQDLIGA